MVIKQHLTTKNKTRGTNTREYIVLHHTATKDGTIKWVINQLTVWPVSCHYIVDTNGDIYKIWEHTEILWHAGVSEWKGKENMNQYSVGIEIIWPLPWFTDAQMIAVRHICEELLKEFKLTPDHIIRHKDIAPGRKTDVDDSFWSNEYKSFSEYQNSYNSPIMSESQFKSVFEEEAKQYRLDTKKSYEPTFSDLSWDKTATISDIKYLIQISRLRDQKASQ